MPTSVPIKGEQVVPKAKPERMRKPKQLTVFVPPVVQLTTTTVVNNPVIDHLGDNFEHTPLDQDWPRHICTESAAIRCLRTGEGVISNLPHE